MKKVLLYLVSAVLAKFASGENILKNPGFEEGAAYWNSSGTEGAYKVEGQGRRGSRLTHWFDGKYAVETSQALENLEPGFYRFSAYTIGGAGGESYIFLRDYGGKEIRRKVKPSEWNDWRRTATREIRVTSGRCEIGIASKNRSWFSADDLVFEKVRDAEGKPVESTGSLTNDGKAPELGDRSQAIQILANKGFDYARIRLLIDPPGNHGLHQNNGYVLKTARIAKDNGMRVLLDLFYSDWWADPAHNRAPDRWASIKKIEVLEEVVYRYTKNVLTVFKREGIEPEMIQIGNEVNPGMCLELGGIYVNGWEYFVALTNAGYRAVKEVLPESDAMIHYAGVGPESIDWYKEYEAHGGQMDVLGVSFYEMWHGSIDSAADTVEQLHDLFGRTVYIVETAAYWKRSEASRKTNYPHTREGQNAFLRDLIAAVKDLEGLGGVFYWGATWTQAHRWLDAPSWNNDDAGCRGLFDDEGRATPGIAAFQDLGPDLAKGVDISEALYAEAMGVEYRP
ncbi:MAG: glycosyl hydrolase 53 family protein [Verrucomicrobiota bacterium]